MLGSIEQPENDTPIILNLFSLNFDDLCPIKDNKAIRPYNNVVGCERFFPQSSLRVQFNLLGSSLSDYRTGPILYQDESPGVAAPLSLWQRRFKISFDSQFVNALNYDAEIMT